MDLTPPSATLPTPPGGLSSAGELRIAATYAGGRLCDLRVDLQRPLVVSLFHGQNPEAVVKTLPYLYSLCAHAQRAAAQQAVAAALGQPPLAVDHAALWTELLHETLWRLLLDWPPALGLVPAKAAFVTWRALRQGPEAVAATQALLAGELAELAEKCQKILVDREPTGPAIAAAPPARFVPLAPAPWLDYWQGLSGQRPQPLRPASIAAAYAALPQQAQAAAAALAAGTPYPLAAAGQGRWGVGQTLSARGILTHAVHLDHERGRVIDYHIWAPTDAHFADAAGLAQLLAGQCFASREAARQALTQAVLALDPCLPFRVELDAPEEAHHA